MYIVTTLLQFSTECAVEKKNENRSIFREDMDKKMWLTFLAYHIVVVWIIVWYMQHDDDDGDENNHLMYMRNIDYCSTYKYIQRNRLDTAIISHIANNIRCITLISETCFRQKTVLSMLLQTAWQNVLPAGHCRTSCPGSFIPSGYSRGTSVWLPVTAANQYFSLSSAHVMGGRPVGQYSYCNHLSTWSNSLSLLCTRPPT